MICDTQQILASTHCAVATSSNSENYRIPTRSIHEALDKNVVIGANTDRGENIQTANAFNNHSGFIPVETLPQDFIVQLFE
jgi:hypothetical protein